MVKPAWLVVISLFLLVVHPHVSGQSEQKSPVLHINEEGYYEIPGLNVMMFDDFYPEGHQGGLTIVQCGTRVAANGDVRLEPGPGQWSPVPKVGQRHVDTAKGVITVQLWYPDSSQDRKGFNPITYPDLRFKYTIRTEAVGNSIKLTVDLEEPLPASWANRVGFNLELFPGQLFGEHYFMDDRPGIFPRQANGPMRKDEEGSLQITPMAVGKKLIVAPGNPEKEIMITTKTSDLQLVDGRGLYNNGWFVVRTTIPLGAVKNAVEWTITPKLNPGWKYKPVIQVSQIGYHPKQTKFAVIELDKLTTAYEPIRLIKIGPDSETVVKMDNAPVPWGRFLRYQYLRFDFTGVTEEGFYRVEYGTGKSSEFEIKSDVFARNVWQPTLEYFLPIQMCHMTVKDRFRVWHGLCHMDDAVMSEVNHDHFDGYFQGPSTLTKFNPGEHVPGLNIGGWHDAGDYDLRVESQAETVYKLALAYEFFKNDYDETSIDQKTRVAEIHKPDGKPDILQQIEHGVLSIVGGYESMGRLYRGMQEATLDQYVHLGDAATITDNLVYKENEKDPVLGRPLPKDDRWVFTEENPRRELSVAQTLSAASRVLKKYNPELSRKCLTIAEELYAKNVSAKPLEKINTVAELYLSTSDEKYREILLENADLIATHIVNCAEVAGRIVEKLGDPGLLRQLKRGSNRNLGKLPSSKRKLRMVCRTNRTSGVQAGAFSPWVLRNFSFTSVSRKYFHRNMHLTR